MVKYAGLPSDQPAPPTPRPRLSDPLLAGASSAPRMRLASIAEDPDGENPFQEARTMDISARSTDFGYAPVTQPARRDRAMLLRMDGVGAGQVVSISQMPYSVGRHATNNLPIDDDSISRFHARFVCEDGEYFVEDLGSRNGTFIQGKRVMRSVIKDDDWVQLGARVAFRFTLTDSRQEGLLRKLYESSTRDALTGAYNRRHFDDRLRSEIAFAVRHSTDCALVLIDLDHFKRVNDTYGHPAGDEVLRIVPVQNGEIALIPERFRMLTQNPRADRMKRAAPKSPQFLADEVAHASHHLAGSFVGKGQQQNPVRRNALVQQKGHAIREGAGFAGTRTGDDQRRAGHRRDRRQLLLVEFARVVNVQPELRPKRFENVFVRHGGELKGQTPAGESKNAALKTADISRGRCFRNRVLL